MTVPERYVPTGEPAIASYNAQDIAAGTGIVKFYGGITEDSTVLSNFTYYSNLVMSGATVTVSQTPTKYVDMDF